MEHVQKWDAQAARRVVDKTIFLGKDNRLLDYSPFCISFSRSSTMVSSQWHTSLLQELGLYTLYHSPRDTKLLCLLRFVRLFAYGCVTLILVLHLALIHISKTQIGVFMTLTLVGDTVISFFLTLFADALGRKKVLAAGALMMAGSGVVFALSSNFWILLGAAVVGVISPG